MGPFLCVLALVLAAFVGFNAAVIVMLVVGLVFTIGEVWTS